MGGFSFFISEEKLSIFGGWFYTPSKGLSWFRSHPPQMTLFSLHVSSGDFEGSHLMWLYFFAFSSFVTRNKKLSPHYKKIGNPLLICLADLFQSVFLMVSHKQIISPFLQPSSLLKTCPASKHLAWPRTARLRVLASVHRAQVINKHPPEFSRLETFVYFPGK